MRLPTGTTLPSGRPFMGAAHLSALALGLGLVLSACSAPDTAQRTATSGARTPVSLEHTLDVMLRPSSATTAETFLRTLPAPLAVHDTTVANPHDRRRQDTVRTLRYDGLTLTVYRVQATGTRFPVAVLVTSPAYHTQSGLRVGLAAQEVVAILGEPGVRHAATWIYRIHAPMSAPYELTVTLRDGRVQSLRWAAYLD